MSKKLAAKKIICTKISSKYFNGIFWKLLTVIMSPDRTKHVYSCKITKKLYVRCRGRMTIDSFTGNFHVANHWYYDTNVTEHCTLQLW